MKAEQAKKLADEALKQLAAELEQGPSDTMKNFLTAMSKFHRYSFGNIMLITLQRPDATHVAGFRTWRKFNRWVKKGEKGIVIMAPMAIHARPTDTETGNGSEENPVFVRFKAVHVFDVAQTDGEPLPEPASVNGDPGGLTEKLKAFVAAQGITLEHAATLGGADGVSSGTKIILRQGLEPAHEFHVLVHELAHETLHHQDGEPRPDKTVRETEAEAVAFIVSQAVGLDTNGAAADYIQLYRGNPEMLAASLTRIQQTAARIIEALDACQPSDSDGFRSRSITVAN